MARNFYDCAKNGGKVVSKKTKEGKMIKVCYDKDGNSHVKFNNKKNKNRNKMARNTKASVASLQNLAAHFNNNRH